MLILRNTSKETEGEWFSHKVRGEEIEVKVRPLSTEHYSSIRKKYKRVVHEKNPTTRQLEKVESYDDDAIGKEIIDFVLEDFRGFGSQPGVPLEVTLDNKVKIMEIPAVDGELSIADFVFDKSKEIAAVAEEDFKTSEKN